jgi:hypothetical protein
MSGPYEIDTTVQLNVTFSELGGIPFDPSAITLFLEDPTGNETTVSMGSLTHGGTGVWSYQFTPAISGTWVYKFQGSGNCAVTTPDTKFVVRRSALIPG